MATPIITVTMDQPITQPIQLGQAGENQATIIQWPDVLPQWQEDYGEGTVQLINLRSRETTAYPVAITVDGTNINWLVTNTDTAIPGAGLCELQYIVNDVLAKSILYRTIVSNSISSTGTAPSPGSDWITQGMQQVTQAQADAVQAIGQAQTSATDAITAAQDAAEQAVEQAGQAQIDAIQALDVYTKTESDARYAPIASALTVSGTGDNLATSSPAIPWYMQGLTLFGKTTQDGTPTPSIPVPLVSAGDDGQVDVTVCGENVIPVPESATINGVDFTVSGDETIAISFSGPSTQEYADFYLYGQNADTGSYMYLPKGTNISFIYLVNGQQDNSVFLAAREKTAGAILGTYNINQALKEKSLYLYGLFIRYTIATSVSGGFAKVWSNISGGTTFYPYKNPQQLTIQTTNGLPGIPVTSGGNYTDASGQQYISNVLDFSTGLETIALDQIDSYNGEEIPGAYMSTTGSLTTGATVIYALSTPTTQPIDAETLAAYQALQSYSGTTNVICDGCGIQATALANANQLISTLTQRINTLETAGGTTA